MSNSNNNETLISLIKEMVYYQKKDKLWQREPSQSSSYTSGKLVGYCLAKGYDVCSGDDAVKIYKQGTGKLVCSVDKNEINIE